MSKKYIKKVETAKEGVKIITIRNVLREKAGYGGIDSLLLERAEEFIQNNKINFPMLAQDYLIRSEVAIDTARSKAVRDHNIIYAIIRPIMGLKAGGGMFQYDLITEISDIMLKFLEGISDLNDDALDILEVYQKITNAVIDGKLTGTGGDAGKILTDELYRACRRYAKKHPSRH